MWYIVLGVIAVSLLIVFLLCRYFIKEYTIKLKDKESYYEQLIAQKEEFHNQQLADKTTNFEKQIADKEAYTNQLLAQKEEFYNRQIADKTANFEKQIADKEASTKQLIQEQEKRFGEIANKLNEQINNASEQMLKARQQEFSESSKVTLDAIIKPLKESMGEMKKAMDENSKEQSKYSGQLSEQVKNAITFSTQAKDSADRLTNAFMHKNKLQGNWGEIVLDELLQSQGLKPGINYEVQGTLYSKEGKLLRPDVILHLDESRELIIDSKVSLSSFIEYVNCEDENLKIELLKNHILSIKNHVDELSKKDYSSYIVQPKISVDYVIMFVPNSNALWAALNADTELWRKAMEKGVYIADEQSLYAAIRIIHLTWRQIEQAQNHEHVYKLADEMINRVGQFYKQYQAIGEQLKKASDAYEKATEKLTPGGQSILTTCDNLIKLGAKNSKTNPLPQID